ncbi:DUF885 domain-containing protein [Mycolicibacterium thermoresistibile]|uniref:DUF885 domain-containing protein n=2 Tax=Mycolicibacterium thermoresistibile TaxID=1797 RepID=G7CG65_MYCT3|nr:DUF885 domain-containing protein [Mycolicibacterium thermoresistibile]EHI13494.1 hypothetical protein KEK_09957 [Mycolicibacterium thermoresistibile ATCC 19527]MCV7188740.1 DUF885 domain-containing protein [Mycolicibacterium thermoresistibile]GAT16730.1 putative uncharacterized protein [Mycolicibacterium thermoresistibile]SNW18791.1 Bacterial protein of uncharacterised function (DUF885) [Mycolicibacterium thermoresistibile]
MTSGRTPTAVDAAAERHLARFAALDPCAATEMGLAGYDDQITDYSPDGVRARAELARSTLAEVAALEPADDVDVVTLAALRERLGTQVELHEAGLDVGELNNIASPLQTMRDVFDLMSADNEEDWALISTRLSRLPDRVAGYAEALRTAANGPQPPAIRQVRRGIEQAGQIQRLFVEMATDAPVHDPTLRAELLRHSRAAAAAYQGLATVLAEEIAPRARTRDACGRDAYRLFSRWFLGAAVDLDETYEWGLELLKSIQAEQESTANQLYPGVSVAEALDRLDTEPRYLVRGTDALQAWMQDLSDRAVQALADHHFDIPEPLRRLECLIAPTNTGGIYYTGPSEDFSRPGRMWWSVPPGVDTFHTWQETTTVFHEGVPGHHLQIGRAVLMSDRLNRWRRLGCFVSGHGEGWALYAERLMAELGWLDDAGDRMGMLDAQRFRAARVVIDIGVHCELTAPDGTVWDAAKAADFLARHTVQTEEKLRFELDRYLGWPGQAPSYAVGQRIWQQLREEMTARGWPLKQFHSRALDLGGLPLDVLRSALLDTGAADG